MEKEFYTELIYRHKCPDDWGATEIKLREAAWDLGLENLLEMFHTIVIGATYGQESFENVLSDYLEERGWRTARVVDIEEEDQE